MWKLKEGDARIHLLPKPPTPVDVSCSDEFVRQASNVFWSEFEGLRVHVQGDPERPGWPVPSGALHFRERFAVARPTLFGAFLSLIAVVTVPSLISNSPWQDGHFRLEETITVCERSVTIRPHESSRSRP